jgi:hypothetical protein
MRVRTLILMFVFVLGAMPLRSQSIEVHPAVGIEPYHHPVAATYRLIAGGGANAAQFDAMPITEFAVASLRHKTDLFSVAMMESRSSSSFPRTTFTEFDLLYGYAYEYQYSSIGTRPILYHFALSSGLSLDTYSERWRRSRRMTGDFISVRPNVFEYSLGLPVQAQLVLEPGQYFGFGLVGYANFSKFKPNVGLLLGIEARY